MTAKRKRHSLVLAMRDYEWEKETISFREAPVSRIRKFWNWLTGQKPVFLIVHGPISCDHVLFPKWKD